MSDYATQLERAVGAGYSAADAKMAVGHSRRLALDRDEEERTADEVLSAIEENSQSATEDLLCEIVRYAVAHLAARHRDHVTTLLNQYE
jgi:hypothetical protein